MRTVFLQDWGTYPYDTIVVVGQKHAAVVSWLKRKPKGMMLAAAIKELTDDTDFAEEMDEADCKGLFKMYDSGRSILWLKEWTGSWKHTETLMHEVHHAVHFFTQHIAIEKEAEAQAYQFEYLFWWMYWRLEKRRKIIGKPKSK